MKYEGRIMNLKSDQPFAGGSGGASGIAWLAPDAPQDQSGKFFRDRNIIP
jgi:hypothetical protein